jgi:hypothetical protein
MMTYDEWMEGTKLPAKRTKELKALDTALQTFWKTRSAPEWEAVLRALDGWARKKGLLPNGAIKTQRNEQVVKQFVNEVIQYNEGVYGVWLEHDIKLARTLCDPFIKTRVVGQGLGASESDQEKYKKGSGQSATALFDEIQKLRQGDHNIKPSAAIAVNPYASQDFWLKKGAPQQHLGTGSGLWCDASAALIIHLLAQNPNFKSSLHIVSQGDPKHHGHWYVVANRSDNDLLQFKHFFGPARGAFNFTIDIWGAIRGKLRSAVVHPGRAIYDCRHGTGEVYDHNNIKVQCRFAAKRI